MKEPDIKVADAAGSAFGLTPEAAVETLPPDGQRFATLMRRFDLEVEVYAPRGKDLQTPHDRDEIYVVARGSGIFFNGTSRKPFATGDFLYVPAGIEHRFEEFSDDLVVWVIFWGPRQITT